MLSSPSSSSLLVELKSGLQASSHKKMMADIRKDADMGKIVQQINK
jgi:hypothetical protein